MAVKDWKVIQLNLEAIARKFLWEAYGIHLDIPVRVNGRLKNSNGRFTSAGSYKNSIAIEISKNYIEYQKWEMVISTLKHECIHYALYELDLPSKDGDEYFENELKKHGSHSTRTVSYKGKVEEYACSCCDKRFTRKRKLARNGFGFRAVCCNASLVYYGQKIV